MRPVNKFSALFVSMLLLLLTGCGAETENVQPEADSAPVITEAPVVKKDIIISEFMEKNRAVIADEDGDFSDWIELYNTGNESVNLKGWRISDNPEQKGWKFPDVSIEPGEYLLVFASKKEKEGGAELHADFGLSGDEGLYLKDAEGNIVSEALCGNCDADIAMVNDMLAWQQSEYPSPGFENSVQGYEQFQQTLEAPGPLVINEAMSYDDSVLYAGERGYCDWLEIKNISDEPIELSDYWLSDDDDQLELYNLPRKQLAPGECMVILCDDTEGDFADIYPNTGFALSGEGESLYLTKSGEKPRDFCSLRSIPYGCSYGRSESRDGWLYFSKPTPGKDNAEAKRLIADTPTSPSEEGVFEGVEAVEVELEGYNIRYTLDGSAPTEESLEYTGPISLTETCVLRASCFAEDMLPSFPMTMSFIINEGHTLPVVSLATDSPLEFKQMYEGMSKGVELPGSISLYRDGDSFTIGCGVSLNGQTSLVELKKNMALRFRGAYGDAKLEHDIYGGGVTEFTNLLLRSGQDYMYSIIRNELSQSICELADMKVINQRSIHCILYINGEYFGIYTLKEKSNEQLYASLAGVSRDSVTVYEAPVAYGTDFYSDVVSFATMNDMSLDENYEQFCSVMDVDSLIDWLIIEGFCANTDVNLGNLRYCRSSENDGKWRMMFYDLDSTFRYTGSIYYNLLSEHGANNIQVGAVAYSLMANEDFCDRFLTRAAELYKTVLTNDTILSEIDRLSAHIAPEVERDYSRYTMELSQWEWYLEQLRANIIDYNWRQCCIDALCQVFELSADERAHYFGEIDGK
ncbi:MAG: CotH kinase family protein [Oscillospiraceae bacterium]|nr:CotH kinase family protein [Oscillospiraceae bacterium]